MLNSFTQLAQAQTLPYSNYIELTGKCNLNCPHCYVDHQKEGVLTTQKLISIFDQLANLKAMRLTFTGGEIGLRKDLFLLTQEARKRHFAVVYISTGTLWKEKEWDTIAGLGVHTVRMSVYATEAKFHDAVTASPGSFEKTMATAKGLRDRGVAVAFLCSITAANIDGIPALCDWCEHENIPLSIDSHITVDDHGGYAPKLRRASREQLITLYQDPRMSRFRSLPHDSCSSGIDNKDASSRPCTVGASGMFIQATGDVLPCTNWPEKGGNILTTSIEQIWNKSAAFVRARGLRLGDLTGCNNCGALQECRPCAGMALWEEGTLETPVEIVCESTLAVLTASHAMAQEDSSLEMLTTLTTLQQQIAKQQNTPKKALSTELNTADLATAEVGVLPVVRLPIVV